MLKNKGTNSSIPSLHYGFESTFFQETHGPSKVLGTCPGTNFIQISQKMCRKYRKFYFTP